jgi:hypothetical protein
LPNAPNWAKFGSGVSFALDEGWGDATIYPDWKLTDGAADEASLLQ